MEVHEKIQRIRVLNDLTQDEMAEKLSMSKNGYAKIEHGETDVQLSRLEQIAKIFGLTVKDIFNLLDEKSVFNFNHRKNQNQYNYINSPKELTQELEKLHLLIEEKEKQLALQQEQIEQLKEIILLLKNKHD